MFILDLGLKRISGGQFSIKDPRNGSRVHVQDVTRTPTIESNVPEIIKATAYSPDGGRHLSTRDANLRRRLTIISSQSGLSYRGAGSLRGLLSERFLLNGTRGVYDNETTARNLIYCALDSIPDFKKNRIIYLKHLGQYYKGSISKSDKKDFLTAKRELIRLIRKHVLKNGNGSGTAFIDEQHLNGLVANKRKFLKDKTDSFGALLRFALPGLIDEIDEYAIRPHEVEHDYLNTPKYAERLFLRTLSKDLGSALDNYLALNELDDESVKVQELKSTAVKNLAKEIRKKILDVNGGGEAYVRKNKLDSLFPRGNLELSSKSFGGLIERFLPGVINADNTDTLQPHEVFHGNWKDEKYVRLQLIRAFCRSGNVSGEIETYFSKSPSKRSKQLAQTIRADLQELNARQFFLSNHLNSLNLRTPDFIDTKGESKFQAFIDFCFPEK